MKRLFAENQNISNIRVSPQKPLNPSSLVRQTETVRMHRCKGSSPMHLVIHSSCNASQPPTHTGMHCELLHLVIRSSCNASPNRVPLSCILCNRFFCLILWQCIHPQLHDRFARILFQKHHFKIWQYAFLCQTSIKVLSGTKKWYDGWC